MNARRHAAVITVSDSVSEGQREDRSGPAVDQRLQQLGWTTERFTVCDGVSAVSQEIARCVDSNRFALVCTTGGTGVSARDLTPEATRAVLDREIPGLGELMRAEGLRHTRKSVLSRATGGTRGRAVVLNLPGSPAGAVQSLDAVADLLPHILDLLDGNTEHNPTGETTPMMRTSEK